MALAVRVIYGNGNTAGNLTASVGLGSGVADGDVLVACLLIRNTNRVGAPPASGWTQRATATTGGNDKLYLYTKRASGEPASETWGITGGTTDAGWQVEIVALSGGTVDAFFENADARNDNVSSASTSTNSISAADASAMFLAFCAQRGSSSFTFTFDSPYSEDLDTNVFASFRIAIGHHLAGATTENATGTWSSNPGTGKLAAIIAVKAPTAQNVSISQAAETDTAVALSLAHYVTIDPATETDAAQPLSVSIPQYVTLSPAVETDVARPLSISPQHVTLTPATETDEAQRLVHFNLRRGTGRGNGGEQFCLQLAPNGTSEDATLASAMSPTTTTIALTSYSGLPASGPFCLTIDSEVVYVLPLGGGVYRILQRALSGTTAAPHSVGALATWGDTYLMEILVQTGARADFIDLESVTVPGWLITFDSTQAQLGASRYAAHVAELVGVYPPDDVGGTSRLDGPQPNAICIPEGVTENCPAALSAPARIETDIEIGDIALVRYTNNEASVLELCSRSCAVQSWYGFKRVDDTDNDVTFDTPPDPPFGTGGAHVVDVLPLDATESVHGAQEGFHDTSFITTTLAGTDRYFTFGSPTGYNEKGWPIAALAVRQGTRRVPHWTSPDWHNFAYVYSGFAPDATFVQVLVNRNGLVFGPEPEVVLPGPQDIDGPNATWDDGSYYSSTAWYVGIFEGGYVYIGPVLNVPPTSQFIPPYPPVGVVGPGGEVITPPAVLNIEGGEGGGIDPPFPELTATGLRFQTESIVVPYASPHIEVDLS